MKIETKFDLGETVYVIRHAGARDDEPEAPYYVDNVKIYEIHLAYEGNPTLFYEVDDASIPDSEEEVFFKTKEEAQVYCDNLNEEEQP